MHAIRDESSVAARSCRRLSRNENFREWPTESDLNVKSRVFQLTLYFSIFLSRCYMFTYMQVCMTNNQERIKSVKTPQKNQDRNWKFSSSPSFRLLCVLAVTESTSHPLYRAPLAHSSMWCDIHYERMTCCNTIKNHSTFSIQHNVGEIRSYWREKRGDEER